MARITLYHNPACSNSRNALAVLNELGAEHDVVLYLDNPPNRETLAAIIAGLADDPVTDLVRRDANFVKLGLSDADVATAEQVIDTLVAHPELTQRPILVRDGNAIIGRPKDRVAPFVSAGTGA